MTPPFGPMSQYSQTSWILLPHTTSLLNLQSDVHACVDQLADGAVGSHCSQTAGSTLPLPHSGIYAPPHPQPPPGLIMTMMPVEAVLLLRFVSPEVCTVTVLVYELVTEIVPVSCAIRVPVNCSPGRRVVSQRDRVTY